MENLTIHTIGHSTKKIEELISKLLENKITMLVDVRSRPYSRYNPQFNRESLRSELESAGIQYVFRGKNLGGLDENIKWDEAIDELVNAAKKKKEVVVMCSEGDHRKCHRYSTIQPALNEKGVSVHHIFWGKDVLKVKAENGNIQISLF